jgi:hypothetical protein
MPKYHINVAMSIRAYGFIELQADDRKDLIAKLSVIKPDAIQEAFQPHGGGDDDFDYCINNPDIYLSDAWDDEPVFDDCIALMIAVPNSED